MRSALLLAVLLVLMLSACGNPQEARISALQYFNQGNQAFQKADYGGAVRHYNRALELDRQSPDIHYNLGLAYYQSGQLERAVKAYHQALRLSPDFADAHMNLALAYDKLYNLDTANHHYNRYRALVAGPGETPQKASARRVSGVPIATGRAGGAGGGVQLANGQQLPPGLSMNALQQAANRQIKQQKKSKTAASGKRIMPKTAVNNGAVPQARRAVNTPAVNTKAAASKGANPNNNQEGSDKWWIQDRFIPNQ